MMAGEVEPDEEAFGDLVALKGVVKYPIRIKCAVLAWDVLQEALDGGAATRRTRPRRHASDRRRPAHRDGGPDPRQPLGSRRCAIGRSPRSTGCWSSFPSRGPDGSPAAPELAVFATSAVAILPLAGLIGRSTEQLALHTGPRVGGLINATFGNVTELIIAVFLILDDKVEVVKASLTGSIIGNLLLVLGLSFFLGGLRHRSRRSTGARPRCTRPRSPWRSPAC